MSNLVDCKTTRDLMGTMAGSVTCMMKAKLQQQGHKVKRASTDPKWAIKFHRDSFNEALKRFIFMGGDVQALKQKIRDNVSWHRRDLGL